ncbi:MAG: hypothetical protein ACREVH_11935 [Gammaproteobacteria bacterium]
MGVVTFSISVIIVAVMARALLQCRANTSEVRTQRNVHFDLKQHSDTVFSWRRAWLCW